MSLYWKELCIRLVEGIEGYALSNQRRFRYFLRLFNEDSLRCYGKQRAKHTAWRAYRRVPAYRALIEKSKTRISDHGFEDLPVIDKNTYVRAYPTEERCVDGSFLVPDVMIDESSGSTGIPYNWVRGRKERIRAQNLIARMIEWFIDGKKNTRIAINAFSMGAWATGVNMNSALSQLCVVKSTGPDIDKILHTLEFFGPKYSYVICGYPPFLKLLVDTAVERSFPIHQYEMHGFVGGEGMSEGLRYYLLKYFKNCISGYGASDLEMGIATETPESIKIRGLLFQNQDLRKRVLAGDSRTPMVFQYNPAMHYIETNENNELIITLNYSQILSPRIRYNIGDEGMLLTRKELLDHIKQAGLTLDIEKEQTLPYPYLMLFGRADQTISIMGANIYTADIEKILYDIDEISKGFSSFTLSQIEDEKGLLVPQLSIEWSSITPPSIALEHVSERCTKALEMLNSDFRNAQQEYGGKLRFVISIHGYRQGPFAQLKNRIKNSYLKV